MRRRPLTTRDEREPRPRRALPPRRSRLSLLIPLAALGMLGAVLVGLAARPGMVAAAVPVSMGRAEASPGAGVAPVVERFTPAAASGAASTPGTPAPSPATSAAPGPATSAAPGPAPSEGLVPRAPATTVSLDERLVIGSLAIDAPVVRSGVSGGEVEVPGPAQVGALAQGAGRWLYTAHVSWEGAPAAFGRLAETRPGTVIDIAGPNGHRLYRVTDVATHPRGQLPADVFATDGPPRIVLVTCTGPRVEQRLPDGRTVTEHRDNLVVSASPLS